MEFLLSSIAIVTTSFSFFPFLVYIINKKRVTYQKPPQPKGAWPVIGHLLLLGGSDLPHKILGDMAEKYGPIFTIKLGLHRALVVSNAEFACECLKENDKAFASRPKGLASEIMGYNYALLGLSEYGYYWRKVRKIVTLEVLSQRKVMSVEHLRVSELRASIKSMYDVWLKNKDSGDSCMVKVEMRHWFVELTSNIIVSMISGKKFLLD